MVVKVMQKDNAIIRAEGGLITELELAGYEEVKEAKKGKQEVKEDKKAE